MDKTTHQRTVSDRLISGFNAVRYALVEPVRLALARAKHEHLCEETDESPLVSVYTPTYNRAKILMERAVPTVLGQNYKNLEYVIVGDCCTDETEKLVSSIGDPRIVFYNLLARGYRYPPTAENHWLAGPVVAANKALEVSHGKWIARIDDDDTWTPDHIESLLRFAQREQYEFVSAQYEEERYGKRSVDMGVRAQDTYYTRKSKTVRGNNPLIGGTSTWLYRSYLRFFKYDINCWRKSWNRVNDADFSIRMFKAGVRMGFLEQVVACVLPRPGEATIGLEAYKIDSAEKQRHFKFS